MCIFFFCSKYPVSKCHCLLLKSELFQHLRACTYFTSEVHTVSAFAFLFVFIVREQFGCVTGYCAG